MLAVTETPDRGREVHAEMAALQRHADEVTPSLRARRRVRRRGRSVRRSLKLALLVAILIAVIVVVGDAWGVRTAAVDLVRDYVIDPSRGR
jgi:hypothetical protein